MTFLKKINSNILNISKYLNFFAAVSVTLMMLLTCADVVLRFFRCPIPGTYEIAGFLGAIMVSFSLAVTTLERSHIAVEFLVDKLPKKLQKIVDQINSLICTILFAAVSWYSVINGLDFIESGQVSETLQMPVYPFIFGVALGFGLLSVVLFLRFINEFFNLDL